MLDSISKSGQQINAVTNEGQTYIMHTIVRSKNNETKIIIKNWYNENILIRKIIPWKSIEKVFIFNIVIKHKI